MVVCNATSMIGGCFERGMEKAVIRSFSYVNLYQIPESKILQNMIYSWVFYFQYMHQVCVERSRVKEYKNDIIIFLGVM